MNFTQTNTQRVLIVDDEDALRTVFLLALESSDYKCSEAGSGASTYEIPDEVLRKKLLKGHRNGVHS